MLHLTESPTLRPLESEPRLTEQDDSSTGRMSAFRTSRRAVEEDEVLRQPEQKEALREMALALAEVDPYLCALPQTHTEGQLAHRSALARDRAIAAMVNYINEISLADLAILERANAQIPAAAPPGTPTPSTPTPPPKSSTPPPRAKRQRGG